MHVVYVTTELATSRNSSGGLASYVANMSRIFLKNGHKVTIFLVTTKETDLEFDENIAVVNIFIPKKKWEEISEFADSMMLNSNGNNLLVGYKQIQMNLYKSKLTYEAILNLHRKEPIDIVQVTNLSFLSSQFGTEIPYVVRMSSFMNLCDQFDKAIVKKELNYYKMGLMNKILLDVVRENRFTFSPSFYLQKIGKDKYGFYSEVLESPFAASYIEWDYSLYHKYIEGNKYVLYFGTLKFLKGVQVIGELIYKFLEKNPELYFVLAGNDTLLKFDDGSEIYASKYISNKAECFSDRVIYVGRPVREELYPIIKNAQVCIMPSRIENLSNACIEAMSLGKIVVATNGVSYEQLINDGENGFLRERDNADSFLEGIETVLALSDDEKKIISENAEKTTERLRPEKIYKQYYEYYQKVIREWNANL